MPIITIIIYPETETESSGLYCLFAKQFSDSLDPWLGWLRHTTEAFFSQFDTYHHHHHHHRVCSGSAPLGVNQRSREESIARLISAPDFSRRKAYALMRDDIDRSIDRWRMKAIVVISSEYIVCLCAGEKAQPEVL